MKGSLHPDELMGAVVAREGGIRTDAGRLRIPSANGRYFSIAVAHGVGCE
jgi:hypothetical protein